MRRLNILAISAATAALTLMSANADAISAEAHTWTFKAHESGAFINIPLDPDADSCTTTGGVTVCSDFSSNGTFGATGTGPSSVEFVGEYSPVSGSGCVISGAPVPIAGCTLSGSTKKGCEFQSVDEAVVYRFSRSGDLLFASESDTICEDLSAEPPFDYSLAVNSATIIGGTGKLAGASGTITGSGHGQVLLADPAKHHFGWFDGTTDGTITVP
jgi:hypothetical protein